MIKVLQLYEAQCLCILRFGYCSSPLHLHPVLLLSASHKRLRTLPVTYFRSRIYRISPTNNRCQRHYRDESPDKKANSKISSVINKSMTFREHCPWSSGFSEIYILFTSLLSCKTHPAQAHLIRERLLFKFQNLQKKMSHSTDLLGGRVNILLGGSQFPTFS